MRYEHGENYVEMSEKWTRGEVRRAWEVEAEEFWSLYRSKIDAIHLEALEGDPITDPDQLTEEALDRLDYVLFTWLNNTMLKALTDLNKLGEAAGRTLFDTPEKEQA